jgi:predicted PurR-regulated permease PerM
MSGPDNTSVRSDTHAMASPAWLVLLKRLAIWGLFLLVMYLARDFFFTAFMTFLFSYLTLSLVGLCMRRLSPGQERPGLRRLLTLGVFLLGPLILLGIGILVGPRLIAQGQRFAGWLGHLDPETEVTHLLQGWVGPSEFKQEYGGPSDQRYRDGLEEFRKSGERHVAEYYDFPKVENWVEGGFRRQFADAESGRIRSRIAREGTSSKEFEDWFLQKKVPQLQEQAKKDQTDKVAGSLRESSSRSPRERTTALAPLDPLVRAAASANPAQLLQQARHDPAALDVLRQQWLQDALESGLASAQGSPAYQDQLRAHYNESRASHPDAIPFTFDEYVELQKARPQGPKTFGDALEKLRPSKDEESEAGLRADFEAAKQHELFQVWWSTSTIGKFIRHEVESSESAAGSGRAERVITTLLNLPLDLSTALLLSFFICIDFPRLKRALGSLRETWLRDVYHEMAPALTNLGHLIGRALFAQGCVSACNATLIGLALWILGVDHAALLAGMVFVLCLVPTLGMIIAWVLISVVALVQPGGGFGLVLKVSGAVLIVIALETFVFSPRILGKMMELHPVLIMALLPLAQYFFGVWGLILATPVAVYVVHVLILQRGLPGSEEQHGPPPVEPNGGEETRLDSREHEEGVESGVRV